MPNLTKESEKKTELIRQFKNISVKDLPLVGGKGANLGEMIRAGFPVPDGFCVTTDAFDNFFQENSLYQNIYHELEGLKAEDTSEISNQAKKVRGIIMNAKFSQELENSVINAWKDTGENLTYAIRSSATAEDLPDHSFAGQQDTYLNVRGEKELLEKVKSCFASLFTDRAVSYRIKNGFEHSKVKLCVVVQRQILSEYSGIMFTVDPISENRNYLSINASYGLGEALVSGIVNADLYKYDKKSDKILEKKVNKKQIAIIPQSDSVRQVEVEPELQQKQALTDKQIKQLAKIGIAIEKYYQSPQDIEWAIFQDKIFITQSRAITTLYPKAQSSLAREDEPRVLLSLNHIQVMTEAILPMGQSVITCFLPVFRNNRKFPDQTDYMLSVGGRLYIDVNYLLESPFFRKLMPVFLGEMDSLIGSSLLTVINDRRFSKICNKERPITDYQFYKKILNPQNFRTVIRNIRKPDKDIPEQLNLYIKKSLDKISAEINEAGTNSEKVLRIMNILYNIFDDYFIEIFPALMTGMISFKALNKLMGNDVETKYIQQISMGMEGNITTEMNLELGDLADLIRKKPGLNHYFQNTPVEEISASYRTEIKDPEFLEQFELFISKYGNRAQSEIDISRERWKNNNIFLFQAIIGNLSENEIAKHRKHFNDQKILAKEAENIILSKTSFLKKKIVKKLIDAARVYLAIREHHKFFMINIMGIVRDHILQISSEIYNDSGLENQNDIFYLRLSELYQYLKGQTNEIKTLINLRKSDYQRYQKLNPARLITTDGERIIPGQLKSDNKNILIANGVSPGIVEGIARIIVDPQKEVLKNGEILVTHFTDPGWTPLFIHAKALVMEVGGLMTHGSVVAREYGIPAVVGLENATAKIRDGQRIRVNGDSGIVELLEDKADEK